MTDLRMLIAELRPFACEADIGSAHQLRPAGEAEALHRDDDGQRARLEPHQNVHPESHEMIELRLFRAAGFHFAKIGAGAEMLAARADEKGSDRGVFLKVLPCPVDQLMHFERQAVELFRAAELDDADGSLGRDGDRGRHLAPPLPRLSYCRAMRPTFSRAMTSFWICAVPSPICRPRTSL